MNTNENDVSAVDTGSEVKLRGHEISEGMRFGRWLVLSRAENDGKRWAYLCRCDCGLERVVLKGRLNNGTSQSCGCYFHDRVPPGKTHGASYTPEYRAWIAMKSRCNRTNLKHYGRYGGRGITYAPQWEDFDVFIKDVGARPSPKHSLDRIDNDGNYKPENVKWSTQTEQCRNLSRNHNVTFNGETKCVAEWAEQIGINRGTLNSRLVNYGWSVERALTEPVGAYFDAR